ncbi:MAG: RNA polymerase sigma factor FliA [Gammaproteobacteria bacterium]
MTGTGAASYVAIQNLDVETVVTQHASLVKRIAYHMKGRLPDTVLVDDLIQSGMVGLLEAARNYDPSHGASFETYAGIRIRGAMLDEIRRGDWTPRSVHRKSRQMMEAIKKVENRTLSSASDAEVAKEMGIDINEYNQILRNSSIAQVFSIDDGDESIDHKKEMSSDSNPDKEYIDDRFQAELTTAIDELPERERLVMSLYYEEEMNLKEIGSILEVSESRVCQIHGKALVLLRAKLNEWLNNN